MHFYLYTESVLGSFVELLTVAIFCLFRNEFLIKLKNYLNPNLTDALNLTFLKYFPKVSL